MPRLPQGAFLIDCLMPAKKHLIPQLIDAHYRADVLLRHYFPLDLSMLEFDGKSIQRWMPLRELGAGQGMVAFEFRMGAFAARAKADHAAARQALKSGGFAMAKIGAMRTFMRAVEAPFLVATGSFYESIPDEALLRSEWRRISAREGTERDQAFLQFCRLALAQPVLDLKKQEAVRQFIEAWAALLARKDSSRDPREAFDALRRERFTLWYPHPDWTRQMLGLDPWGASTHFGGPEPEDWEKTELGLSQMPTNVMALLLLEPRAGWHDPVGRMIRAARLRSECHAWARLLDDTQAFSAFDGTVYFMSSGSKASLKQKAEALRGFAKTRLGRDSAVGIGNAQAGGELLSRSREEALAALHLGLRSGGGIYLAPESRALYPRSNAISLSDASSALLGSLESLSLSELGLARERYLGLVLELARGRADVACGMMMDLLTHAVLRAPRHSSESPRTRALLLEEIHEKLMSADSLHQMLDFFDHVLQLVAGLSSRPAEVATELTLNDCLRWLEQHFRDEISLGAAAKRAGLSVSAFCRAFKSATGQTYRAWTNAKRIAWAQATLQQSPHSIQNLATLAGFKSVRHFNRIYKRLSGIAPLSFRRLAQKL